MKKIAFLLSIVLSLIVTAEPYRPYPVIMVHGYNANNYNGSNFGITILSDKKKDNVTNYTASSPDEIPDHEGKYYISRNEGKRIEYNKLAYKMAELNKGVLNNWHNIADEIGMDTIYWIRNDNGLYNQIPSTEAIQPTYLGDTLVDRPINCFLETMEFDYPEIGSSDSIERDNISRVLTKMI